MDEQQDTRTTPLLSLRGIVKRFGTFTANDHIDLDVRESEAHALIGENGAGKSTLVKIIYGLLEPTEGTIAINGETVRLSGPEAARAHGIGMVFQHFSLFDNLTVAENIALVMSRDRNLPDLRSRLNALPVASLSEPDDAVLAALLDKFFRERNIRPPEDLTPSLVRRIERSAAAARDIVVRLDETADALHRPISKALAREILEKDSDQTDMWDD